MLGHRGCRLAISYPEIPEMQARAIFEAALAAREENGGSVMLEIMVPLIATRRELEILKAVIDRTADAVAAEKGARPDYIVGTMIELPRAALQAGPIAEVAEFFSFGTNDLTQTTYGVSRDDAGSFMQTYEREGIFAGDPFVSLDAEGVGDLVDIATESVRGKRNNPQFGICGGGRKSWV